MYKGASRRTGGYSANHRAGAPASTVTQAEYIAARLDEEKKVNRFRADLALGDRKRISLRYFSFDEAEHSYTNTERRL